MKNTRDSLPNKAGSVEDVVQPHRNAIALHLGAALSMQGPCA